MNKLMISILTICVLMTMIFVMTPDPVLAQYLTSVRNWNMTESVIDSSTIGANSASTGAFTTLAASGNATVGGTLGVTGALTATGGISGPITSTVEVFDANDTLTAAESGLVCVSIGFTGAVDSNNLILTLPPAAAGLTFTFVDANAEATDDLWITAGTGDTINGGTAAKSFVNTGDVVNASCVFECRDGTDWIAMPSAIGSWANDNN